MIKLCEICGAKIENCRSNRRYCDNCKKIKRLMYTRVWTENNRAFKNELQKIYDRAHKQNKREYYLKNIERIKARYVSKKNA